MERTRTIRVGLYIRVSTSDQKPDSQLHALRDYAQARGLEVVGEYADLGVSGARRSRPALDRLVKAAKRREIDAVVITKLDRLGRSLTHLLALLGDLEALGVELISLDDGIDTSTPAGRLFMQMRGAFAEYERALIRERVSAGIEAAKRRGKHLGRPKALTAEQEARVRRLRASGHSLRSIAETVGVSKSSVARVVSRKPLPADPIPTAQATEVAHL